MTAEEIFRSKIGEFKSNYPVIYDSDGIKKFVIEAMEQYRNEGLREALLDYSERYVFLPYPAQSGTHEDLVDEYLKQKP